MTQIENTKDSIVENDVLSPWINSLVFSIWLAILEAEALEKAKKEVVKVFKHIYEKADPKLRDMLVFKTKELSKVWGEKLWKEVWDEITKGARQVR